MAPVPRQPTPAERFLPGAVLAGRYRMVGLLGRGGMGEVYRADDLKLGQPVALKFLPREVERDADRLERFLTEVRLSLRVTHPNVCRVFDIGEMEGRHFLSMEYVDGEDLASLLRRIGRLPEDKAVEISRQLCAGLAAAHEEGVLHRDLKPANVMIDGRGRAKITDFGLAGATSGISGHDAQVGTPQYMAPEQIAGGALSERTDLYSLGLVLYELFTGKRAFDAKDLNELARLHSSTPTNPSAHVSGLNPAVERAILRCVDPDPAKRPASAASLAAALPGGDPLAMALAAGETPSPEMVARAGGEGALRPAVAAGCLLVVLLGLAGIWIVEGRTALPNRVALPKPPAELVVAARAALAVAGYATPPAGTAFGFEADEDYFDKVTKDNQSPDRWDNLRSVAPAPVWFWYRESPGPLAPAKLTGYVGSADPPLDVPGMSRVRLDPAGRVVQFRAVPPELEDQPGPWSEPDWTPLLSAAGFKLTDLQTAEPLWAPPDASDVRRAWIGGTRDALRVEAAAFRGRPVWFAVIPTWRQPYTGDRFQKANPASERAGWYIFQAVAVLVLIGSVLLARRNIRLGRSDRRGAFRFAALYVALGAASDALQLSGAVGTWFLVTLNNLAQQLLLGALVWIFYVALEPHVRRLWPGTLIAWSRALEGRFRDPLVGRHLLFGSLAGVGVSFLWVLPTLIAPWIGIPARAPDGGLAALAGSGQLAAEVLTIVRGAFFLPVAILLLVLLFRVVFRRPWLAYAALFTIMSVVFFATFPSKALALFVIATYTIGVVLVTRLGLLAFLTTIVFSSWTPLALTTDPSSWFFPASVVTMLLFAGLAVYAFVVSLGGQRVFKESVLE
jgi:eukaryotic-like serine/threonine-protein kinase